MLRPTPGDPWGVEQHHWNTGAKENQQLNPGGPSNRQKSSGHAINRKIRWTICHKCKNKKAYICHKQKKTTTTILTHHLLSITEYPYFSSIWVKIDQLKQLKGYTMMFQYIPCDFWLCLDFFSASFCHCLFSMCEMLQL